MDDERYIAGHKNVMDRVLLAVPGVKGGQAFGYPAYKANGKVFAFVGGAGVALKLPAPRVQELIAAHPQMKPFQPTEGVVWREWVSIDYVDSAAYEQHEALYTESIQFVTGS